ncbi:MAG: hypothetical protein ACOYT4_04535 [Nanoarchaeota archaeon]
MAEEGDLVLCTVEKIEGTSVFVRLPSGETGTIMTSEIAPGRIRNIRDYVIPNKKIVCKVLRAIGEHIDLSLRRVTSKEKKEILEKFKQEQIAKSVFHQILKEKAEKIEGLILKDFQSLSEFMLKAKENKGLIQKYIPTEFYDQIEKITQKKQKQIEAKKILKLKCLEDNGIVRIKKILSVENGNAEIIYLSAGKFQITIKDENYKEANRKMEMILEKIEKTAKQNSCEFEALEK